MVISKRWTVLGASVRGASHEQGNLPNQDAFRLKSPHAQDDAVLIAVADGHGSSRSFRSERGSAMAAECALRVLRRFIWKLGANPPISRVRRHAATLWPRAMVRTWRSAVRADVAKSPFSPLDFAAFPEPAPQIKLDEDLPSAAYLAYGATLVAVAITPGFILYSQLGDGDILTIREGGVVSRPLPRQHEFMSNRTVSLCTYNANVQFQIKVEPVRANAPSLIMLSTDGYANCFGNEDAFFHVGSDLLHYLRAHGTQFVDGMLEQWLRESSRDGSGDDITVGLAVRDGFHGEPPSPEAST